MSMVATRDRCTTLRYGACRRNTDYLAHGTTPFAHAYVYTCQILDKYNGKFWMCWQRFRIGDFIWAATGAEGEADSDGYSSF